MKRRWWHSLVHGAAAAVIVSAAAWSSAWAQVPGDGASGELPVIEPRRIGYSVRHWTVEDGLPMQSVTSLAQTTDGILWCGTFGGLARFDGFEFKVFDENNTPELADLEIQELRADNRGRLWILGLNGDLARMENGIFERFRAREDPGLPPRGVSDRLSVSPGGVLWFRERNRPGYYRFGNGGFEKAGGAGWPGQAMDGVVANDESPEWGILARDRMICRLGIGAPPAAPEKLEAPHDAAWLGVGRFFRSWNGTPAATSNQGIYTLRDGEWNLERPFPRPLPIPEGKAPLDGAEDPYRVFWIGTRELGVTASLPDGRMAHVALGNPDRNHVRSLLCDRNGNVWVAKQDGLFRMRRTVFQNWSAADGLQGSGISSLAIGAEGVWMLTSERGILHHLDSQSGSLDSIPGLQAGAGGQLAVESDGSVLVGTESGTQVVIMIPLPQPNREDG